MRYFGAFASLCLLPANAPATDLTPNCRRAFGRYVQLTEERLASNLQSQFLYGGRDQREKARRGEVPIIARQTRDRGKEIDVPDGLVHDWLGLVFIPRATINHVRAVMQDYDAYKHFYKPEVTESKVVGHNGSEYDIFLRLYKQQVITVVFNTTYHVTYQDLDGTHMVVNSRSTRIAELKDPNKPSAGELPVGHDDGFLWALNSYWRFEQADGGVYAQLQAVSLSRDLPFLLGWLKGFVQKFPVDSMEATLRGTKKVVEARIH